MPDFATECAGSMLVVLVNIMVTNNDVYSSIYYNVNYNYCYYMCVMRKTGTMKKIVVK